MHTAQDERRARGDGTRRRRGTRGRLAAQRRKGWPGPGWGAEPAVGRTATDRRKATLRGKERPRPRGGGREETRLGTRSDVTAASWEMQAARRLPQGGTPTGEGAPRTREEEKGGAGREGRPAEGAKAEGKGRGERRPTPQVELDPVDPVLVGELQMGAALVLKGNWVEGEVFAFDALRCDNSHALACY